ncbi:MAG: PilT/PilU family type 4a pilus ATPase [Planctomycetes bacterium]|nr:PilT/PilU family type 4a pilus ATPase [Planctomycetota bacterium]
MTAAPNQPVTPPSSATGSASPAAPAASAAPASPVVAGTGRAPRLRDFLRIMAKEGASDLVLKTRSCPAIRVAGAIRFLGDQPLTAEILTSYLDETLSAGAREDFERKGAADSAVDLPGIGRFRCNTFHQNGEPGFVFRAIKGEVPSFKDLNLPVDPLKRLASLKRGLVLATGIAGSGKSTTLASMVEFVNRNLNKHIITIEDPIEFRFEDKRSIVNQREVGVDVPDFASALRQAVRQSPDVIYIGEMRDVETVSAAIAAAETGHLVFSTLHTVNAVQTVERIITFFPPHQHDLVRLQLALNLAGVVSLRLIKNKEGNAMVPAVELLINTPTVRELLEQGQTRMLPKALAEGSYYGTLTFNQSLIKLFQAGNISLEDALTASDNPDELKMQMRGITSGATNRPVTA